MVEVVTWTKADVEKALAEHMVWTTGAVGGGFEYSARCAVCGRIDTEEDPYPSESSHGADVVWRMFEESTSVERGVQLESGAYVRIGGLPVTDQKVYTRRVTGWDDAPEDPQAPAWRLVRDGEVLDYSTDEIDAHAWRVMAEKGRGVYRGCTVEDATVGEMAEWVKTR